MRNAFREEHQNAPTVNDATESDWESLKRCEIISLEIDNLLQDLEHQEEPVLSSEMRNQSHDGGKKKLETARKRYYQATLFPEEFREAFERELKRAKARVRWGWGFGCYPEQEVIHLLRSKHYTDVVSGLVRINRAFIDSECPSAPDEDHLFR